MTKEEAKDILEKYVKGCEGNDFDLLMTLNDEEIFDAIKVSINSLSVLPSNLDEAEFEYVQSLDEMPANQEEENMIYDAFKAGAEWRDAQIPKLPNSIDDAAEKMYPMTTTPPTPIEVAAYHNAAQQKLRDAFKAGVKWISEQRETVEGYITDEIAYNGIAVILDNEGQFKPGDKVIVQIRKKEK